MSVILNASADSLTLASQTRGARTFMGWFRPNDRGGNWTGLFCFDNYNVFFYGLFNMVCRGYINGSEFDTGNGSTLTANQWYHIAVTLSGTGASGTINTYIDGVLDQTDNTVNMPAGTSTFYIGNSSFSEYYDGEVAYIKTFDAVLTAAEIQAEMMTMLPQRTSNLIGYYPTYEGTTERARDYSGQGNDLTENGTLGDDDENPSVEYGAGIDFLSIPEAGARSLTASITETADTVAATLDVLVQVSAAITEISDTVVAALVANPPREISANITEDSDTVVATLQGIVQLSANITEDSDVVSADINPLVSLQAAITEASDTVLALIDASVNINLFADITEVEDTVVASIQNVVSIASNIQELPDTVVADLDAIVSLAANILESRDQVSAFMLNDTPVDTEIGILSDIVSDIISPIDLEVIT